MDDIRRWHRGALWAGLAGFIALTGWVLAGGGEGHVGRTVIDVLELAAAAVATGMSARAAWQGRSLGWMLIAGAAGSATCGQLLWALDEVEWDRSAPIPSWADWTFLGLLAGLAMGMFVLSYRPQRGGALIRTGLDMLLVSGSLVGIGWSTVLGAAVGSSRTGSVYSIGIAYQVAVLVVVAVVLGGLVQNDRMAGSLHVSGAGALVLAAAMSGYSLAASSFQVGTTARGTADLAWILGFVLLAVGARQAPEGRQGSLQLWIPRLCVVQGVFALAAVAVSWRLISGGEIDGTLGTVGLIVTFTVLARQIVTQGDNRNLTTRLEAKVRELSWSEGRFRSVFDNAADTFVLLSPDQRIMQISASIERASGWRPEELIGQRWIDLVHPHDQERVQQAYNLFLLGLVGGEDVPMRLRKVDGQYAAIEASARDQRDNPTVGAVVISVHDITDRLHADAAIAEAREQFRVAFQQAPIGMCLSDADGVIVRVNAALAEMLGYTIEQMVGMTTQAITHPDDWEATAAIYDDLANHAIDNGRVEKRYLHADGHIVWGAASISFVEELDGTRYILGSVEDITEHKAMAEYLAHSAVHDEMTGLPNRAYFVARLDEALTRSAQEDSSVAVIFLDLDHFKDINDSLGHAAGDELLQEVAYRLRHALRADDLLARFGGDEFTVLLDHAPTLDTALDVADRLAKAIVAPVTVSGRETYVTASLGVVLGDSTAGAEAMLRDADAAMYRAKEQGRGRTEVFDPHTHERAMARLRTASDLHRALERNEFRVYYQPITMIETGLPVGFEALVRWAHPERGVVGPADFIELAEDTGLIVPMGLWVLEEACRQLAVWQRGCNDASPARGLGMHINLSTRQVADPDLVSKVSDILARTQVNPSGVWLEITESVMMRDTHASGATLRALRHLGAHLTVDDFGTGYSSLTYLRRFPVEGLKIDRSFVAGLGHDAEDTAIVTAVIRLAHALNLHAVAEGVETLAQLEQLRALGCDLAQGYLFGRPQPAEQISIPQLLRTTDAVRVQAATL